MVILFKPSDKSLIITKPSKLLQGENAVDRVIFYFPEIYNNVSLSDANAVFSYICSSVNVANMEILAQEESNKDGYIQLTFPVTTAITKYAGTITGHITFTKVDQENNAYQVLSTRDISFEVEPFDDYYKFVAPESISPINAQMLQIDNDIQKLKNVADEINVDLPRDLSLDNEGLLQLKTDSGVTGDGVSIAVNYDLDSTDDGVTDLDALNGTEMPINEDSLSFVDLDA